MSTVTTLGAPGTVDAPFAEALAVLGVTRPDTVVLAADLSRYTDVADFAQRYPHRFVQVGMAEQNLMGVGAGLAKAGWVPIITTYGVFATRRAYEQVALALSTGRRPVVIAAFLPGITTPFRATHQAIDDIALMRNIPGMTVVDPMDAIELRAAVLAAVDLGGPVYVRGLRGTVPAQLDADTYRYEVGATHLLRDGADVGIVATGLGTTWALQAAERLESRAVRTAVLHVPTIKPFPTAAVLAFASRFAAIASVENHSATGGLGSAIAEALSTAGSGRPLLRLGTGQEWPPAGSLEHIRRSVGLDAAGIADRVAELLRQVTR